VANKTSNGSLLPNRTKFLIYSYTDCQMIFGRRMTAYYDLQQFSHIK